MMMKRLKEWIGGLGILLWLLMAVTMASAQTDVTLQPLTSPADSDSIVVVGPVPLSVRLDSMMNRYEALYPMMEIGFSVYDLTADSVVCRYQDRKLYRPASTQKIFTSISALDQLGPDARFETTVYRTGAVVKGTLQGDLYVVGGLDPEFSNSDLAYLMDAIQLAGIERIDGKVIGDISMKDSIYWGNGWSWDDVLEDFQPQICPLMLNKGFVEVAAVPGRRGQKAKINIFPESSFYQIDNQTISRMPNRNQRYKVTRNWMQGGNRILVTGNVTANVMKTITLADTPNYFMTTFMDRLKERGIHVEGGNYIFGKYTGEGDFVGRSLHNVEAVMRQALKESDNLSAEALFYKLGTRNTKGEAVGSDHGVKAIEEEMRRVGLDPSSYRVADGSGVSLYNYTTADAEVSFLRYAYKHPFFRLFYSALPIAGVDGTLANRMKKSAAADNVHAKTGTVTGVSTLAGYVTTSKGNLLAFSILCNGLLKASVGRSIQNELCIEMAR